MNRCTCRSARCCRELNESPAATLGARREASWAEGPEHRGGPTARRVQKVFSTARCGLTLTLFPFSLAAQDGTTIPQHIWRFLSDSTRAAWMRPLASALVPGAGQLLAGQDRGAVYLVVETVALARFVGEYHQGKRDADHYRDLALQVARRAFNPQLRDTAFGYFEEMARFIESGPFDTDPGPGLRPPWDDRTFNGRIWRLARETFFTNADSVPDPESVEYQRALEFYRRRAVGPNFLWSWRGAAIEHDLFQQTIRASDDAFRRATQLLGLVLVNHLVSVIDAYVSHRLSVNGTAVRIQAALGLPGAPGRLSVVVSF